jgi:hypothetical protein
MVKFPDVCNQHSAPGSFNPHVNANYRQGKIAVLENCVTATPIIIRLATPIAAITTGLLQRQMPQNFQSQPHMAFPAILAATAL